MLHVRINKVEKAKYHPLLAQPLCFMTYYNRTFVGNDLIVAA